MAKTNVIILGCGRLGALLATLLDRQGVSVLVVDPDGQQLVQLPADVRSRALESDTLEAIMDPRIPVAQAQAVIAVTDSDERNVALAIVCRRARPTQRVFARVADPARAPSYERMGIETIDTTYLAAVDVLQRLLQGEQEAAAPHRTTPPASHR